MQQASHLEKNEGDPLYPIAGVLRRSLSKEASSCGMIDSSVLTTSTYSPTKYSSSPGEDNGHSTYEPSEVTISPLVLSDSSKEETSIHERPIANDSEHGRTVERLAEVSCDSGDDKSLVRTDIKVPMIIPVDDLEDISLMDGQSRYDIEGGRLDHDDEKKVLRLRGGQDFLQKAQEKAKVMVQNLLSMIETKRLEYQTKSRSEQIVIIVIAAGVFLLFILLMALIAK
jgi:hypothetical protein